MYSDLDVFWWNASKQNRFQDRCQGQSLRIVYYEPNLNLDQLIDLDKSTKIHKKHTITLLTEVFKTTRGENTSFMNKFLSEKRTNYQLKTTNLLSNLKWQPQNTPLIYSGSTQLWNHVPDSLKSAPSAKHIGKLSSD